MITFTQERSRSHRRVASNLSSAVFRTGTLARAHLCPWLSIKLDRSLGDIGSRQVQPHIQRSVKPIRPKDPATPRGFLALFPVINPFPTPFFFLSLSPSGLCPCRECGAKTENTLKAHYTSCEIEGFHCKKGRGRFPSYISLLHFGQSVSTFLCGG